MALSLDSIYQPFNDFFTKNFATKEGERMQFRFARLPHTFVDADFVIGTNPNAGLALQVFSEAVDGIATLDADGKRVLMGTNTFSDLYYFEILSPSMAFIPSAVIDQTQRQAFLDAFIQVKADAKARWEQNKASSLEVGEIGVAYRPSTPDHSTWWDKNAAVWTPKSFHITGAAPASTAPAKPNDQLLRMKIDNNKFSTMLAARAAATPAAAMLAGKTTLMTRSSATLSRSPKLLGGSMAAVAVAERPEFDDEMQPHLKVQLASLPYRQRWALQHEVAQDAPTQPVASTEVTISFDFCVVNIERQWMHPAFLNNGSWYISGQSKGQLSANDGHGAPAIAVGFVAIKSLRIKAPWTPADISNLANSVQFGPFNFSSDIVDGALCHDDIQIVAWMLEDLPDLPPNAMP